MAFAREWKGDGKMLSSVKNSEILIGTHQQPFDLQHHLSQID